jgi:hypothetical protein
MYRRMTYARADAGPEVAARSSVAGPPAAVEDAGEHARTVREARTVPRL